MQGDDNVECPSNVGEVKKEEDTQNKKGNFFSICALADFEMTLTCHLLFRVRNVTKVPP